MTGIKEMFSHNPIVNDIMLFTGSTVALTFPNRPVKLVRFKAYSTNVASVFLGENSANCYWQLQAGNDTGWIPLQNLNQLSYYAQSGTMDRLCVWVQD